MIVTKKSLLTDLVRYKQHIFSDFGKMYKIDGNINTYGELHRAN